MVLHRPVELARVTSQVGTGTNLSGNPTNKSLPLKSSLDGGQKFMFDSGFEQVSSSSIAQR